MNESSSPAVWLGYDAALLAKLTSAERSRIERVAEAWLLAAALLALSFGYGLWLVSHAVWLFAVAAAGLMAFLLNALRLVAAGSGPAPDLPRERLDDHRPSWTATWLFVVVGLLLGQLAQLPLHRRELDAAVAAVRADLVAEHAQLQRRLERPVDDAYQLELNRSEFVVLRLRTLWKNPGRVVLPSLAFALLVGLPGALARFHAAAALGSYERLRRSATRRVVREAARRTEDEVATLLSAYPSYRRRR